MTGRNTRVSKSTVLFSDVWLHPDCVRFTGEQKTPRKSIQSNWIFELKQQTMGKIGHYTHKYISLEWKTSTSLFRFTDTSQSEKLSGSKANAPNKQCEKGLKQRHIKEKRLYSLYLFEFFSFIYSIYKFWHTQKLFFFHKQPKFLWNKIK